MLASLARDPSRAEQTEAAAIREPFRLGRSRIPSRVFRDPYGGGRKGLGEAAWGWGRQLWGGLQRASRYVRSRFRRKPRFAALSHALPCLPIENQQSTSQQRPETHVQAAQPNASLRKQHSQLLTARRPQPTSLRSLHTLHGSSCPFSTTRDTAGALPSSTAAAQLTSSPPPDRKKHTPASNSQQPNPLLSPLCLPWSRLMQ